MPKKLYVFGIGGTGSRVIKSLAMLLASGVKLENDFDTIIPILIDPDTSNGDLNRTKDILRLYQEVRSQINTPDDFFRQDVKTINELADPQNTTISPDYFQFRLNDVDDKTFGQYIGFNELQDGNKEMLFDKSFVNLLYSHNNLSSNLNVGFKGNPNMGAIVLNQFTYSDEFKKFGLTFGPDDAIFIVNSIFGGTGAAGFPLLLKNLRGNTDLQNFSRIKDAPIGGITYLPYFTLDQQGEINASSFEEKAKIALDYYNRTVINQRQINVLHFVGNRGAINAENYAPGQAEQKNKAHFLELAGALAIIEFCKNIKKYSCSNGQTIRPTEIKEFGIERNQVVISFDDLNIDNKNQIFNPLTKFRLFTQYLEKGLSKAKNVSRWTKSDFYTIQKLRKSPCNPAYFDSAEFKNQVIAFTHHFKSWIDELSQNKPAFSPFFDEIDEGIFKKLDTENCLNVDNLKLRTESDERTGKLKQIHTTLVKLFGISTSRVNQKLPIRINPAGQNIKKVFRLHEGQEGTGWFLSSPFNKDALQTIKTEGQDVASSIPSPFARIDLVKSAFDWINFQISSYVGGRMNVTEEDLIKIRRIFEADTAQNKLISSALDVAMLFFKAPALSADIEIVAYKPKERFENLSNNRFSNLRHSNFAKTLEIYWTQDSVRPEEQGMVPALYNFEHITKLFFIINKNTRQIIGGTSPASIFFAAPDASTAIQGITGIKRIVGLADNIVLPLHKRDGAFIEYFYSLARQRGDIAKLFPEVYAYLENVKMFLLESSMRAVVSNLTAESINVYKQCATSADTHNLCEVLNMKIGVEESYFTEKVIKLPYYIDATKFQTCGVIDHLIPLTQVFFQKYGIENIENYCKLRKTAGEGLQITLTLPAENGQNNVYTKIYHSTEIVELDFHLAILPFISSTEIDLEYTIGVLDSKYTRTSALKVECLKGSQFVDCTDMVVRKVGDSTTIQSSYFKTRAFDAIRVTANQASGFIAPKFYKSVGNNVVSFAVDFGTTNTHIEYKKQGEAIRALDADSTTPMWQSLIDINHNAKEIYAPKIADNYNFDREIFPYEFNSKNANKYKFPFRTAITYNSNLDFTQKVQVFTHTNNFLLFEKLHYPTYLKLETKLKWSNYNDDKVKVLVTNFIEGLMYMVLYKTLLLNGRPADAKIYWFYPVSMDTYERGIFKEAWNQAYRKIFKVESQNNIISMPESIPPYLHYRGNHYVGTSLSIDIGGGSSDIAVFENAEDMPKFISSVKFAGNAIFGDGFPGGTFSNNSDNNGFVNTYKENALQVINPGHKKHTILKNILETRKDSADFCSFLFSLANDNDVNFNFTQKLMADRKLKLPILVFFGSLLYYASNLVRKQDVQIPKNILFSGTAAKTLRILDPSDGFVNAKKLFTAIINRVTQKSVDDLQIALTENPKEITCKGVLRPAQINSINNCPVIFWLGGAGSSNLDRIVAADANQGDTPLYESLSDEENKESIEKSILQFYDILDSFIKDVHIESEFGIDRKAYEIFKGMRHEKIKDLIVLGIRAFNKKGESPIEETIFFYPLIGILHSLAVELSKKEQ